MSDIAGALRALTDPPLAPRPPIEQIERRARALVRRRRIATALACATVLAGLSPVLFRGQNNTSTRVTSTTDWRLFQRNGLRVRLPPGWGLVADLSQTSDESTSSGGKETTKTSIIPAFVFGSRQPRPAERAVLGDEGKNLSADLVLFFVEFDDLSPGHREIGLLPELTLGNGVRVRRGHASDEFVMEAYAGTAVPDATWALVDGIAASVRVPDIAPDEFPLDAPPSQSYHERAATEATTPVLAVKHLSKRAQGTVLYDLLVGNHCASLQVDPPPPSAADKGQIRGRCVAEWRPLRTGELELFLSNDLDPALAVVRIGPGIARIAGRLTDGRIVEGVASPDGWGAVLVDEDPDGGYPILKEVLAFDATGREVSTASTTDR